MSMDYQTTIFVVILIGFLCILVTSFPHCLGLILLNNFKKPHWALAWYSWMIKSRVMKVSGYINRSMIYLRLKEYRLALQDANTALLLNSDKYVAYNNRGAAYCGLKDYQHAVQDFNSTIALRPTYHRAYRNRAYAYWCLKYYQKALSDIEYLLTVRPMDYAVRNMHVAILLLLKQYQQVIEQSNSMLITQPEHSYTYHNRGLAYLALHNLEQGKADLLKSQQLNPGHPLHSLMLEWYRLGFEQPDEAMAERLETTATYEVEVDERLQHIPFLCRGIACWLRGRYEEGLIELEQAVVLAPDDEEVYFWVGMVCASLGRDIEAQAVLTHALKLGLPRVWFAPLRLLKESQSAFFAKYAQPLLEEIS